MSIPKKTLEDLEFNIVVENISKYAITSMGRDILNSIKPDLDFKKIDFNLNLVSEYLSSLENDNNFPNHGFENISKELKIIIFCMDYLQELLFPLFQSKYCY